MAYSLVMGIRIAQMGVIVTAVALLVGCASTGSSEPGKYDQTWTKSYSETTCGDWYSQMDAHEKWVAAADMLVGMRDTWGIKDMPSDSLIDTFEGDITQGCEPIDSVTLSDAAVMLAGIGGQAQYGG